VPEIKQVILVRKDLKLRRAAFAAMVAKASFGFLLENNDADRDDELKVSLTGSESQWLFGNSKRIVLNVDSEDALRRIANRAELEGISTYSLTKQSSEMSDELMCLTLGPDEESIIDQLTSNLKLA